ncbi:Hypotetical protein [Gulosibacter molinativorax]|nr:Hypotetical protein [Gulosibacter molinativorax]
MSALGAAPIVRSRKSGLSKSRDPGFGATVMDIARDRFTTGPNAGNFRPMKVGETQ